MAFFFSRSTQECTQDVIKRMFGVQEIKHYEKYLGFHLWLGEAIKLALATLRKGVEEATRLRREILSQAGRVLGHMCFSC